jgi:hypothetical protein
MCWKNKFLRILIIYSIVKITTLNSSRNFHYFQIFLPILIRNKLWNKFTIRSLECPWEGWLNSFQGLMIFINKKIRSKILESQLIKINLLVLQSLAVRVHFIKKSKDQSKINSSKTISINNFC